jgi:hypothetical protein
LIINNTKRMSIFLFSRYNKSYNIKNASLQYLHISYRKYLIILLTLAFSMETVYKVLSMETTSDDWSNSFATFCQQHSSSIYMCICCVGIYPESQIRNSRSYPLWCTSAYHNCTIGNCGRIVSFHFIAARSFYGEKKIKAQ